MSVTSSTTAFGDQEVPSHNSFFKDPLCMVSITRRDGTLMDASSISEEDIVEICVTQGHTHPLGVPHYSAVESIVLFLTADNLKCASCDITGKTELHDEAIMVKAMAPTEAHISAYTMAWHVKPSKGGGRPHTPPKQTPPGGETLHCLHAELGDLNNHKLHQLMADLNQELAQCELIVPPSDPPPNDWVCPSGSQEPEEDDQKVTFPGGGRWGPLRQPTPEQLAGGGVPSGPPQRPPCPVLTGPDMGQLITTLTLGLHIGTPKISTFSGDMPPGKTQVSYEQWSHEVQCIKDHYPELVVRESIIRSLNGAAADMARYMGPTAGVSKILEKLSVIFGMVASFDVLMQNFYKITQGGNEKVPSFVTRLEGTLNQIRIRCPRWIANHEVPWHLKDQLFHGARKHVRDSIRYLYGNPQTIYSELVVAAQRAESETEETRVKVRSAAATEVPISSKELGDQIARLMAALTRAEQSSCPASAPNSPRHRGRGRGQADRNTPVHRSSHNGQTGLG